MASDFLFKGSISEYDQGLSKLLGLEDRRQRENVILIPSESIAPEPVKEAMSSNFANIYAEGYPRAESRNLSQEEILDIPAELATFRRYSDPRYYKGVEYANILEALARRRAAELFAANNISPEELYINVQPLSGSPANIAVYGALLEPGDTIMGLDLNHGGHLTHGSKVSRSGKNYNIVSYGVDPESELLDYEVIENIAVDSKPKLIVAGFTAYSRVIDWIKFRAIADKCGAYLMADIAHISGLVAAGVHPSPIGIADVVTTTTHKSLCGPRGAMIMTHRAELARGIDRSVFPGEQGGPHLNSIAAMAVALGLASQDQFHQLMIKVVENASRLAEKLSERGLRIVAKKSENHMLMIDTKTIQNEGVHLSGDMAARILDVAGIVTNRNTIPGDKSAFRTSGVRMGTVWISQLGYGSDEVDQLATAIADVLEGCKPFYYRSRTGRKLLRSKVEGGALQKGRKIVEQLTGFETSDGHANSFLVRGKDAQNFLNFAMTSDVLSMEDGQSQPTSILTSDQNVGGTLLKHNDQRYSLYLENGAPAGKIRQWLQDLSDGYIKFDDVFAKLPGPVVVEFEESPDSIGSHHSASRGVDLAKPYFIGCVDRTPDLQDLPPFEWHDEESADLLKTSLHDVHVQLGGRMIPFAGWDMPVWYSSVGEEHAAVRTGAGLFDVSHMGVFQASGPHAANFLNLVTTNDIYDLPVGRSQYTFLLLPSGQVIDDLLIYRMADDKFMMVVNAANNDKDWSWLNKVNNGEVLIDHQRPWSKNMHPCMLKDLRHSQCGKDMRVDLALQGPSSRDILLDICEDNLFAEQIEGVPWAGLVEGKLSGIDVIISRTGYTGERVAFELFVHPDKSPDLWNLLLDAGEERGLLPCGLAARDSTRTEAGLPLYGHELAGPLALNPADAGFASYAKLWKPFFIGRRDFIEHERKRKGVIIRFRMNEKAVRRPELGDPVVDRRGKIVGTVTSCAIDTEGYFSGLAYVLVSISEVGGQLALYQTGGGKRKIRTPESFELGSKMPIPDLFTIQSRFPRRGKKSNK